MAKNKLIILHLIIFVIIVTAFGLLLTSKEKTLKTGESIDPRFVGLERNLTLMNEDIEFYIDGFQYYLNLLNDEDYEYIEKLGESIFEQEAGPDIFYLFIFNELLKDEKAKNIIMDLKEGVEAVKSRELTKEEEKELFEKNISCSNLVAEISKKLTTSTDETFLGEVTIEESLDFVFYSPTRKSCLYVVERKKTYWDNNDWKKNYNTIEKIVYDASTQTLLQSYEIYSYYGDDGDLEQKNRREKDKKNKRAFAKFILENSNHNTELLKASGLAGF